MQATLEAGKEKETSSSLELPEGTQSCQQFNFSLSLTRDLRCEIIDLYCLSYKACGNLFWQQQKARTERLSDLFMVTQLLKSWSQDVIADPSILPSSLPCCFLSSRHREPVHFLPLFFFPASGLLINLWS